MEKGCIRLYSATLFEMICVWVLMSESSEPVIGSPGGVSVGFLDTEPGMAV